MNDDGYESSDDGIILFTFGMGVGFATILAALELPPMFMGLVAIFLMAWAAITAD